MERFGVLESFVVLDGNHLVAWRKCDWNRKRFEILSDVWLRACACFDAK
jgi:hypothetical protein